MGKIVNKNFKNNHNNKPYQRNFVNSKNEQSAVTDESLKCFYRNNLIESQVGITEYINNGPGFKGVFKSRYSDFHVNEIDLNGRILVLNDLSMPQVKEDVLSTEEFNAVCQETKHLLEEDVWEQIKELSMQTANSSNNDSTTFCFDVSQLDKEQRTKIHRIIKKMYEGRLNSCTISKEQTDKDEEKKFIKVFHKTNEREHKRWPFEGEYVNFLIHKENLDTIEVAFLLGSRMHLKPSQVNYCGTKDKRGKTTQKFCIRKRFPSQITSCAKSIYGVKVGNFEFSNKCLKLGDLKGNRFRIALRHLMGEKDVIESGLQNVKNNGFINYFGLQRFGNAACVPTFDVGVALLKCDYKLACELILKPRDGDSSYLKEIREVWWKNRNSKLAASMFKKNKCLERRLLEGLAQYGENDYATALNKLPRNMLRLYPHAFQSLLFNKTVSRRIAEFGLKVIPGDLVISNKDECDEEYNEILPENEYNNTISSRNDEHLAAHKLKVKCLTETDVQSGDYSIYDVVLPLPGYDVSYPSNVIGLWYEEMLQHYGLSSQGLKHSVKTFSMPGTYRKIILKPSNMSWKFCSYSTPEDILIKSDWELLKDDTSVELQAMDENKFNALLLEFCLPPSAYATMLLRELLKSGTSAASQSNLEEILLANKTSDSSEKCVTEIDNSNEKPLELDSSNESTNHPFYVKEENTSNIEIDSKDCTT